MHIRFITTGGTIDKIYFDALSDYHIGESPLQSILGEGLIEFGYDVVPLLRKDSLDMTDEDRAHFTRLVETYHRIREWSASYMPTALRKDEAA